MMKLRHSPASPYARKVLVVAMETGLDNRIEIVPTATTPTKPNLDLARENPLIKLPALVTEGGETLYDSRVICEYLDSLHDGRKLFPPAGGSRWRALKLQALGDGLLDAGILIRYELMLRPEAKQFPDWIAGQTAKVREGLDWLEREADQLAGPLDIGQIAIACALGWLEFRKPAGDNRAGRPRLFGWFDSLSQLPSFQKTVPTA